MNEEKHDEALKKEFATLNYSEIAKILAKLGTMFFEPIEKIPKEDIYECIENDYPIKEIREIVEKIKKEAIDKIESMKDKTTKQTSLRI